MSDIVERLRRPVFDSEEWYSALGAAFKMRDAGHRDSCARDLMDSYVDEAATERTEAADEIERLRAQVARLTAEQDAVSVAIGTNEYMDPPDGGNVSLAEQVRRMRDALLARVAAAERDAGRYRWLRNESLHRLIRGPICIDADTWGEPVMACGKHITLDGATLDAAIDAAMEGGK